VAGAFLLALIPAGMWRLQTLAEVQVAPKKQESRASIIDAVKTPLGFFTLGILITEAVLLALSPQAHGTDFTLLVVGAVVGFGVILAMVFVLLLLPRARETLLGITPQRLMGRIPDLQLSDNDLRALLQMEPHGSHRDIGGGLFPTTLSPLERAQRFKKLGLVNLRMEGSYGRYQLTSDGNDLYAFLQRVQSLVAPVEVEVDRT
jgi:hypothetical protein